MLVALVVSVEATSLWPSLFLSLIINLRLLKMEKVFLRSAVMKVTCLLVSQTFVGAYWPSSCLSVCPNVSTRLQLDGFSLETCIKNLLIKFDIG